MTPSSPGSSNTPANQLSHGNYRGYRAMNHPSEADDVPGRVAGVPYDVLRPTWSRLKSRWWNPTDRRVFTPKTYGWGYDIKLFRLTHPFSKPKR